MKLKLTCLLLIACMLFSALSVKAEESVSPPSVSAETAILYCADNCEVLFEKDSEKHMKPASTTKIMTALLALEASSADAENVTFKQEMIAEGSSMYLKLGDTLSLRSLAEGIMLVSGNDAANAIAYGMKGGKEQFAELMNRRAEQLNMTNTHFMNPSGLDDEEHYSCARDLAVLMAYAMENRDFAAITAEKSSTIDFVEPENKSVTYSNHNRLLSMYQYCVGGKTGYTMAAGRCLVTAAEKDGLLLIAVTMNDRNDWQDHIAMYEYGFSQRELFTADDSGETFTVPVSGAMEEEFVKLRAAFPVSKVVKAGESAQIKREVSIPKSLEAPVEAASPYGEITYTLNGEKIIVAPLLSDRSVARYEPNFFEKIRDFFKSLI